jgi:hypothetical protein
VLDEVYHLVIGSDDCMLHLDNDDYIDVELLLNIPDVVMENPFNDYEGLDTNNDLDESYIELDEVEDQFYMDI